MAFPTAHQVNAGDNLADISKDHDALVFIGDTDNIQHEALAKIISAHRQLDARTGSTALLLVVDLLPHKRLIVAPTGTLDRYYDDVRRFYDAGRKAAEIVRDSGSKNPLLLVEAPNEAKYQNATEVAYLGMTQALYQPLEAREALSEESIETVSSIGIASDTVNADWLNAAESGLRVARDLCGTEPERMAPPKFADYCVETLEGSSVSVEVQSDQAFIEKEYPLLYSVNRASQNVPRHHARIVTFVYEGEGPIKNTVVLAGKGVTYDTGGADLKVGGHMAGMSRDKGGAAAVVGFMKLLSELNPKGIKVIAEVGLVRNSLGAHAFVTDEIITSRAGVRVRIGNTDAEGRLVLADVLTHLTELSADETDPEFYSVATLTGHAARAMGPYTALVENGLAREKSISINLSDSGDLIADPAEISRSRREDYDFIRPRTKSDDILSANSAPSAVTARGHQFPMAFLHRASGLDEKNVPYTHIDIAGSGVEGGDWQHGKPTAASVLMLANHYLRDRL